MADEPKDEPKDASKAPIKLDLAQANGKDLGEALGKIGVSQQVVAIFEIAEGVVLLFTPGAIAGVGLIVVGLLGLFAKTDDLASNVDKLLADFNLLFDQLQAEADILTMRSVGEKIALARTALSTLRENPDDTRLKDPNGRVLFESKNVIETLGEDGFYLRPFFPPAAYSDPWSGRIAPLPFPQATGSVFVFDYRLTLPAYLEAIAIRLTILTVLVPNFRTLHQDELAKMAKTLESLYTRIRDGIVPIPAPTVQEILSIKVFNDDNGTLIRILPSEWDRSRIPVFGGPLQNQFPPGRLYGAVERYSAVSVVDHYRSDRFLPDPQDAFLVKAEDQFGTLFDNPRHPLVPKPQFPSQEALAPFRLEYAIGLLARSKAVYNVTGLPKLKAAVNLLKDLAGEPRLEIRPDGDWSVREIDSTVATILFNRPSTADGPNAPIKVSRILTLLQSTLIGFPVHPVSLRQVLDKVALQN